MIKFKKGKLPILWHSKKMVVDVYVCKDLMVHKIPSEDAKIMWTISHVGSGRAVGIDFPPFRTMKEAKAMASELLRQGDWHVEGSSLDTDFVFNTERSNALYKVLCDAWFMLYGIHYNPSVLSHNDSKAKAVGTPKCRKCGSEPSRYALGQIKGGYSWAHWCLKCFPYDKRIEAEKGKVTRW